jgi:hypothetical protein
MHGVGGEIADRQRGMAGGARAVDRDVEVTESEPLLDGVLCR